MQTPNPVEITQHNLREVIEGSMTTPVLVYFWAPAEPESGALIEPIRQLTQQYQGAFSLALLNCQQEQAVAAQFGVQVLPTFALFSQGQAVDGIGGPQTIEAINALLERHLPSQDERNFEQAKQLISQEQYQQALPLLTSIQEPLSSRGDVLLALADCYLETQQFDLVEPLLAKVTMEYQDGYYTKLQAKLTLHEQASNSPEITSLEATFAANSSDTQVALELASQYHGVNRDEDALELLWTFLSKDLNAQDGEMKKVFMDILNALGQSNPLASRFRRQLYSLLY
ncbi:co-chaperone YbbN [Vibrio sp. WJH972]